MQMRGQEGWLRRMLLVYSKRRLEANESAASSRRQ